MEIIEVNQMLSFKDFSQNIDLMQISQILYSILVNIWRTRFRIQL